MKESYFSIALTKTEQKNQTKKQQKKRFSNIILMQVWEESFLTI